ncbi:unnamed protein product [Gongylonema pulchrum]|uniref:t-SNARE coiled-coil homology domain-containing protein n=1 Tax=Gongylonema pulchrum TaxID=637853 RepID=A0A183DXR7_9BILA|nr:unnamed protein product [Gongylonema pulchrum]
MLNHIRKLLRTRKKYEIDEQDRKIMKLSNAIDSMRKQLVHAEKRWRDDQTHIDCLRRTVRDLGQELQETKQLLNREKKHSDSSLSLDTDIIIDVQNELKVINEQIRHFRSMLHKYERSTRELRMRHTSTNSRMQRSERHRAHVQIACAKTEIIAVQIRQYVRRNRHTNDTDDELQSD